MTLRPGTRSWRAVSLASSAFRRTSSPIRAPGGGLRATSITTSRTWLAYLLRIDGFLFQRTQRRAVSSRAQHAHGCRGSFASIRKVYFLSRPAEQVQRLNNAIDSGGITDCLAYWYERFAEVMPSDQPAFIRDAWKGLHLPARPREKLYQSVLWAYFGLAAVYRSVEKDEAY
jgi:hypothetical protein